MTWKTRKEKAKFFAGEVAKKGFDAILLFDPYSFWHLVGSSVASACIIPAEGEPILIVDPSMLDQTKVEAWTQDIREYVPFRLSYKKPYAVMGRGEAIVKALEGLELDKARIGIVERRTSVSLWHSIRKLSQSSKSLRNLTIEDASDFINDALSVLSTEEIELLREATRIADAGAKVFLENVRDGAKECEVAGEVLREVFANGVDRFNWFPCQVVSGVRTANSPWVMSTEKIIKDGEIVQLDISPDYKGSRADISRVVIAGNGKVTDKHRDMFNVVLDALQAAISAVRPGVKASDVDRALRDVIDATEYAGLFTHHSGHPIGGIYGARIIPGSESILRENMAICIESGVYVPGFGGMRLEDDILVTSKGAEVLTKCERTLC